MNALALGFSVFNTLATIVPPTGDHKTIGLYVAIFALSLAGVLTLGIHIVKKNKEED